MESLFPAAVRHIMGAMEPEILKRVFGTMESNPYMIVNVPLAHHIERIVILEQVVKDIQLFDSTETKISLSGLPTVDINELYKTVYIPEHRRGGRDIMSARGISYGSTTRAAYTGGDGLNSSRSSTLQAGMGNLMRTFTAVDQGDVHNIEITSPNTILYMVRQECSNDGILHANLSVSDRLNHIRNGTSLPFIELCVWKSRQIAYFHRNVAMGDDAISMGKTIGVFGEAVRQYQGARETYMELLDKFRTSLKLIDPVARRRMIRERIPKLRG